MVIAIKETTNYKLHLCDDDTKKFKEWREEMSGTNDSNMQKIDIALSQKANSSISIEAVLKADSWRGFTSPFTQVLEIDGLSANHNGSLAVSHSATIEQRDAVREALLVITKQEDGKLTVSADGELPSVDIPVFIILFG